MKNYSINNDIAVVCLPSPDFPKNVPATYNQLYSLLPEYPERRFFGISHPNSSGVIQYKACAEILDSDNIENAELQKFTITKGNFAAIYIVNHFQNRNSILDAFQKLLKHPKLDPMGYCLEIYKNFKDLDVHCMVRLK